MADGNVYKVFEEVFRPVSFAFEGLFYAGALYGTKHVASFLWSCLRGVRTYFLPWGSYSACDLTKKFGKWAVVTGGTSGIGLAFAHEFARRKVNVVIISRSYDDLVNIVSDLQSQYNVQAYGIHADFSLGPRVFSEIEEALRGCEVGILVNNVAIRYDHPQYFALLPHQRLWQLIDVNVAAPTAMTHIILPQMVERRRGVIINVCSIASCTPPIPLTSGYTATMAYMDTFSQTLHYENRHRGVTVQTLLPCFVSKEGVAPSLFTPSPHTYVRHALSTLGIANRTCGYWPHALQSWVCTRVPSWLWIRAMVFLNSHTRTKCLKESREKRNGQVFTRKRLYAHIPRTRHFSNSSRHSELSLRRTPSPHRRLAPVEPSSGTLKRVAPPGGGIASGHGSTSAFQPPAVRRVSREESGMMMTPNRSSTGSSLFSPIQERPSPTSTSTPLSAPPLSTGQQDTASGTPSSSSRDVFKFSVAGGGDGSLAVPQRSSTADSASLAARPQTPTFLRKYSRVLVTPSVARVSNYAESPTQQEPNGNSD